MANESMINHACAERFDALRWTKIARHFRANSNQCALELGTWLFANEYGHGVWAEWHGAVREAHALSANYVHRTYASAKCYATSMNARGLYAVRAFSWHELKDLGERFVISLRRIDAYCDAWESADADVRALLEHEVHGGPHGHEALLARLHVE